MPKSRALLSAIGLAGALAIAGAGAVFGHGGAMGVVKERMDLMKALQDDLKAVSDMMRGSVAYDADAVRLAARRMAEHSGEAMTRLFPKDSLDPPTESLPAIWTDWDRFTRLADELELYANALADGVGRPIAGHGMGGGTAMDGGMMGGGMMGGGMMGGGMMGMGANPSPEMLASMPPNMLFMHVAQSCSSCHEAFRQEKK